MGIPPILTIGPEVLGIAKGFVNRLNSMGNIPRPEIALRVRGGRHERCPRGTWPGTSSQRPGLALGHQACTTPERIANRVNSAVLRRPSLWRTLVRWLLIVFGLRLTRVAISWTV